LAIADVEQVVEESDIKMAMTPQVVGMAGVLKADVEAKSFSRLPGVRRFPRRSCFHPASGAGADVDAVKLAGLAF